MLTRRHIRVKVMQCIYALIQTKDDSLEKQLKFLNSSIENMYNLYLSMLSLLIEIHKLAEKHVTHSDTKYIADTNSYPDKTKFINNSLLLQLTNNPSLKETLAKRKIKHWYLNEEYVKIIYKEVVASSYYEDYMNAKNKGHSEDVDLVIALYKNCIAPNEKIYDFFEDDKLTWVDDFPIVNTFLVKRFKKASANAVPTFFLPKLLKDQQDLEYAKQLLTKTLLNNAQWEKEIEGKTPNWDKDRIAEIDYILLKMAICEFLNFPSIPERVTINEYLEIAKEYSTPKSSIFINGILDKLVKEYQSSGKLNKMGRGLL